jgi:hypothetical protein
MRKSLIPQARSTSLFPGREEQAMVSNTISGQVVEKGNGPGIPGLLVGMFEIDPAPSLTTRSPGRHQPTVRQAPSASAGLSLWLQAGGVGCEL